jgi:uncharacterized protein (DUF1697 family)
VAKRYVALLSAVNVGKRKVPMAQLREVLTGLGYAEVQTYLASGNAVFTTEEDEHEAAARIEEALNRRFGFAVPCLVRDGDYLASVVQACPFPADEVPGRCLHAVFYSAPVGEDRYPDIDREAFKPEEFRTGDRVMYLYLPDGIGRSALVAALAKPAGRLAGITATGRNWNTVKALAGLTAPAGQQQGPGPK